MTVLRPEFGTRSATVTPAGPTVGAVPWGRRCCSSELGGTRTVLRASGKVQQPAAGDAPQLPVPAKSHELRSPAPRWLSHQLRPSRRRRRRRFS